MRILRAILPLTLTAIIVYWLNRPIGSNPAIGMLLDPVNGFRANAEPVDKDFNTTLSFNGLKSNVEVWFDERMVPHITAANDYDLYFTQGYIHAYFRLWQMDLQTRAAGGRISELLGEKALKFDREQRRKGMVYGAENSLRAMEADPRTKTALDGYRDGINSYIASLAEKDYPLEYKLMSFAPEKWENIKTALLLMYMADDLTGKVQDIPLTYYLSHLLTAEELDSFFPDKIEGSTPVIPGGTVFGKPSLTRPQVPAGETWVNLPVIDTQQKETGKGSNNWVLSGQRTKSGNPILCNDPHLSLNLPALWFEMQLTAPGVNVYGATLPGAPGVVIGFNDNISWGFTNNYRDVKDYYAIDVIDKGHYRFNGVPKAFAKRVEVIRVKGKPDVNDTVNYTVHGPVIYDNSFAGPAGLSVPLAMKWMAHMESNELLSLYLLNRADNYSAYTEAISYFLCPAQNFIYADNSGSIALWGQGQYVNKWKGQGKYVMPGYDSTTLWGDLIPVNENPHAYNPMQGYLSSANQNVTDSSYPYWFNGDFSELRAWRINEVLDTMHGATVDDMFRLQNDEHSVLARKITPYMLSVIATNGVQDEYFNELKKWNHNYEAESKAATIFQVWWQMLYTDIWKQKLGAYPNALYPLPERTMQLMQNDKSKLGDVDRLVVSSYKKAVDSLDKLKQNGGPEWYKIKNTTITHLAKLKPMSVADVQNGGWGNTVNAMKGNHGPSWRMVVEMKDEPEGYGVYPGGQSGNPGSKYYATFIDKWAKGEYYRLSFVAKGKKPDDSAVKYRWQLNTEKQ